MFIRTHTHSHTRTKHEIHRERRGAARAVDVAFIESHGSLACFSSFAQSQHRTGALQRAPTPASKCMVVSLGMLFTSFAVLAGFTYMQIIGACEKSTTTTTTTTNGISQSPPCAFCAFVSACCLSYIHHHIVVVCRFAHCGI